MMRTYSELMKIEDFEGRYNYLRVQSKVGLATFGFERWLNQAFYTSVQWRRVRRDVIARDLGCDLGMEGHEVMHDIHVHHMNPIGVQDLTHADPDVLNPEYLISVSLQTHNAIHYGDSSLLAKPFIPRKRNDTKLW